MQVRLSHSQACVAVECPRKWYLKYYLQVDGQSQPQQEFGKQVHRCIEDTLYQPDDDMAVECANLFTAALNDAGIHVVSHEVTMENKEFKGIVDFIAEVDDKGLWIGETKTTSKYDANKIRNIDKNLQMCGYVKYFAEFFPDVPLKGIVYVQIEKPRSAPKVHVDSIHISAYGVQKMTQNWDDFAKLATQNIDLVLKDPDNSPRNCNSCKTSYGFCPYIDRCHL